MPETIKKAGAESTFQTRGESAVKMNKNQKGERLPQDDGARVEP
jgi:hypothetical protein